MAKIVLGMGTSHGPMLSTPPEQWGQRASADRKNPRHFFKGRTYSYDELLTERADEHLEQQVSPEIWRERHERCQRAIAELARVYREVKPDVAVIVGNDQREIFSDAVTPPFSVFWGQDLINEQPDLDYLEKLSPGLAIAVPGHAPPQKLHHPGHPELGRHIIECMTKSDFDVTSITRLPQGPAGHDAAPHAFGFIYRQIMNDDVIPHVPVILNTFFPPNQPTAKRCYDFGKCLTSAIQSWDSDKTVALFASGGLTHFVINEEIDRIFLAAAQERRIDKVTELGEQIYQSGTSEIKNWIPVVGAMSELKADMHVVDYVPCYRSEAGTGNAMGFVYWRP
jgi:hypothetical protein